MSKYTEAIESLGTIFKCYACDMEVANCMECDFLHETCLEALQIADSIEQAEKICIKACRREGCLESECPYRDRGKFCSDLAEIFFESYNQALADIRGDNNDGV